MAVINGLIARPATRRHEAPRPGRRVIRAANANEAAVLSCLHGSLARDTFAFEAYLASDLIATSAIVLVCEVSEAIAGYLCLGDPGLLPDPKTGMLDAGLDPSGWALRAFGVAPQFRRTGVATDLWRESLVMLPDTVTTVTGDVVADRPAAGAWFRARGFEVDGGTHFHSDVTTLRANVLASLDRRAPSTRSAPRS